MVIEGKYHIQRKWESRPIKVIVGTSDSGFVEQEWVTFRQARQHAKCLSINHAGISYYVVGEDGEVGSVFKNGEEV